MPAQGHGKGQKWTIDNLDENKDSIRARVRPPGDFQEGSFRTIDIDEKKGIEAVVGKLNGETSTTTQSYIFDKSKGWDKKKVIAWLNKNKVDMKAYVIELSNPYETTIDDLFQEGKQIQEIEITADNKRGLYKASNIELLRKGKVINGVEEVQESDLMEVAENFKTMKENGVVPKINFGHTTGRLFNMFSEQIYDFPEKDKLGYMDNVSYNGTALIGDLYFFSKESIENMKSGMWDQRSVTLAFSKEITDIENVSFFDGNNYVTYELPIYRGWFLEDISILSSSLAAQPFLEPYNIDMEFEKIEYKSETDRQLLFINNNDIYRRLLTADHNSTKEFKMTDELKIFKTANEQLTKQNEELQSTVKQYKSEIEVLQKSDEEKTIRLNEVNDRLKQFEIERKEFAINKAIEEGKYAPNQKDMLLDLYDNSVDKSKFYKMIEEMPQRNDLTSLTHERVPDSAPISDEEKTLKKYSKHYTKEQLEKIKSNCLVGVN